VITEVLGGAARCESGPGLCREAGVVRYWLEVSYQVARHHRGSGFYCGAEDLERVIQGGVILYVRDYSWKDPSRARGVNSPPPEDSTAYQTIRLCSGWECG
jgi:hypothetical protein